MIKRITKKETYSCLNFKISVLSGGRTAADPEIYEKEAKAKGQFFHCLGFSLSILKENKKVFSSSLKPFFQTYFFSTSQKRWCRKESIKMEKKTARHQLESARLELEKAEKEKEEMEKSTKYVYLLDGGGALDPPRANLVPCYPARCSGVSYLRDPPR